MGGTERPAHRAFARPRPPADAEGVGALIANRDSTRVLRITRDAIRIAAGGARLDTGIKSA
jgi:hypothetical protein